MKRIAKIGAGIAVAALAVGAALKWHSVADAIRSRVAKDHAGVSSGARTAVASMPRWDIGVEQDYDLDLRGTVTVRSKDLIATEIRGTLAIVPLTSGPKQLLRCAFDGAFTALTGAAAGQNGAAGAPRDFAEGLRKPWFIELDGDGKYVAMRHDPTLPDFVGRLWQAVAAQLQMTRSALVAGHVVIAEETDSTGTYHAEYRPVSAKKYERRKLDYVRVVNPKVHYGIVSSKTAIGFDGDGRLASLGTDEVVKTDENGPIPQLTTATHLSLTWKSAKPPLATLVALLAAANGAASTPADVALHQATRAAEIETAQIGGRTYPAVVASLVQDERAIRAGTETDEQKQQAGRAYVALTAILREQPEHLAALQEHVEKNGPLTTTLLDALRDAGTPAAQNVLIDVVKSGKLTRTAKLSAVESLSMVAAPTSETVSALRELQSDPDAASQATYGLASNAFRLLNQNPSLAEGIVKDLLTRLSKATRDDERALVLMALGNAGDPSALDAIKTFLVPPYSAVVRAAAAQALRRIQGEAADTLIAAAAQDSDAAVRVSAVDAISERPVSSVLVSALERILLGDAVANVRVKAVQTAAGWLSENTDLATVLATVSQNDPNEDIRRIARNALAQQAPG